MAEGSVVRLQNRRPALNANSPIRLTFLTKEQALSEWHHLEPFVALAVERSRGRLRVDDVREAVAKGVGAGGGNVMLIWDPEEPRIYAVIVWEGWIYPSRRVFSLGLCGGESIESWMHLWPAICEFARSHGYNQVEVLGRRGWKRYIPGSEEIATLYAFNLDGEGDDG